MKKVKELYEGDFILSLEENALSSLSHGIEHFTSEATPENLKFSIIHVFHALELFLKARLVKVHTLLIYEKPEDRIDDNSRTVCFNVLIKRLENSGVNFSNENKLNLKMLQEIRNSIEHHKINKNKKDVKDYIGRAAQFLIDFLEGELEIILKEKMNRLLYKTLEKAIYSYEERLKKAKKEIEEALPTKHKERLNITMEFCPNCGENTIILPDLKDNPVDNKTHCYFCGQEYYYEYCIRCNSPVLSLQKLEHEDFNPCTDCWVELMNSDYRETLFV